MALGLGIMLQMAHDDSLERYRYVHRFYFLFFYVLNFCIAKAGFFVFKQQEWCISSSLVERLGGRIVCGDEQGTFCSCPTWGIGLGIFCIEKILVLVEVVELLRHLLVGSQYLSGAVRGNELCFVLVPVPIESAQGIPVGSLWHRGQKVHQCWLHRCCHTQLLVCLARQERRRWSSQ